MTSDTLTATVLRGPEAFRHVAVQWRELFTAAEHPWPWLRHSWLQASWELPRSRLDQLRVVLIHEGDTLMMAGAFVFRFRRLLPVVEFLGPGLPQYDTLLWRPSPDVSRHAAALLGALRREGVLPRLLRTTKLPGGSPLLAAALAAGLRRRHRGMTTSFSIPLAAHDDFRAYLHSLSSNLRLDHGRRLRRLAETEGYEYRHETDEAGLEALAWLFDTKRAWLVDKQQSAEWLASGHIDRFLRGVLLRPGAPPWMVATLRLGGRIIAAQLCFIERGLWLFSKIAHDPAAARFSPGRTLVLLLIEDAFARGDVATIDLSITGANWKDRLAPARTGVVSERLWLR